MDVTHSILSGFDNFFFSCLASNVGKYIENGVISDYLIQLCA